MYKRPELELEEWLYTINDRVNQILEKEKKVVIHVSGASASGKTFSSNLLKNKLESDGHKCLLFSTDNYYKGLSRMMAFKINKNYYNFSLNEEEIASVIRKHTMDYNFDDKFSKDNLTKIESDLLNLGYLDYKNMVDKIVIEFSKINFDEPEALHLDVVNRDLLTFLYKDSSFIVPAYSMVNSEVTMLEDNRKYCKDYDIAIIEGIYSLNDAVINNIPNEVQIKNFLDCDNKTLLVRRLKRDIIEKRSSMSPETNLYIALDVVIPAYEKYIMQDKDKADFILLSNYSLMEAKTSKDISIQEKIKINIEDVNKIEKDYIEYLFKEENKESDYYFANSFEMEIEKKHLIRVRTENDKLYSLVHKSIAEHRNDGKIVRPQNIFIDNGNFNHFYKSIEELKGSFQRCHFHLLFSIVKYRKKYKIGNVVMMLDKVDGLGYFLELAVYDRKDILEMEKLKDILKLDYSQKINSYFEEKIKSFKNENELKFLIYSIPSDVEKFISIEQIYLKISENLKLHINKILNKDVDYSQVEHIRIRKNGDNSFYLTLKSYGDVSREEIEVQIDYYSFLELKEFEVLGVVNKQRGIKYLNNDLKMEIDLYDNGLIVGEIEYDTNKYLENDIEKIVAKNFEKYVNVTYDRRYKNYYMAVNKE